MGGNEKQRRKRVEAKRAHRGQRRRLVSRKPKSRAQEIGKVKKGHEDAASPMTSVRPYLTLSEVAGTTMPPATIVRAFSMLGAAQTFKHLAVFAATLANHEGGLSEGVQQSLRIGIADLAASGEPVRQKLAAKLVSSGGELRIAHERVVYFMQGLAAHHGTHDGPNPQWGDLVLLMLACNDHLVEWVVGRADLKGLERSIADVFVASRFDSYDGGIAAFVRAAWLVRDPPVAWASKKQALWPQLHAQAFHGLDFTTYYESFLGPLAMVSYLWGLEGDSVRIPTVDPGTWAPTAIDKKVADEFLAPLRNTLERLREVTPMSEKGLPENVMALGYKPLLVIGDELWAASPSLVREQLRGGAWNRMRMAAESVLAEFGGTEEWLRAFGHRFEEWCQFVAELATREDAFTDQLVAAQAADGEEEIQDVVLEDRGELALFEVKATTVPARTSKAFTDARDIIKFLEKFFFVEPKGNRRGGVVRQIDARIKKIRDGKHSPRVPSGGQIHPCVVTYDNMGEHAILYRWIDARCRDEGLLQDPKISPLTVLAVDDYEKLMSFGANGRSVVGLLRKKARPEWREGRMDQMLCRTDAALAKLHIPALDELYDGLSKRVILRLHGERSAELTITEAKALERLGYHARWIESGVLTLNYLEHQVAQYDAPGSDQHTEHYRNATLQDFLDARQGLSDAEVASVLELGELDPEESFRSNYAHSLIRFAGLTDPQFDLVAGALDSEGFLRLVCRRRLLRLLSKDASEKVLDRAIREGDADVHQSVLDRPELARHHVELLVELGGNKAVRNKAAELLRSRRFRQ